MLTRSGSSKCSRVLNLFISSLSSFNARCSINVLQKAFQQRESFVSEKFLIHFLFCEHSSFDYGSYCTRTLSTLSFALTNLFNKTIYLQMLVGGAVSYVAGKQAVRTVYWRTANNGRLLKTAKTCMFQGPPKPARSSTAASSAQSRMDLIPKAI